MEEVDKTMLWWVEYDKESKVLMNLGVPGCVAKFPGTECGSLKRHVTNQLRKAGATYYPLSFNLPAEADDLLRYVKGGSIDKRYWISKPSDGCGGQGLTVFHKDQPEFRRFVKNTKRHTVVQNYVHNPALVCDGHKFNIRAHILLKSITPFEAYMSKRLDVEVGPERFTLKRSTMGKDFEAGPHIINYYITHGEGTTTWKLKDKPDTGVGNWLSADGLATAMRRHYGAKFNKETFWEQMKAACAGSVKAILSHNTVTRTIPRHCDLTSRGCCSTNHFELFGADLMMDANMKVWLLELNTCPGLEEDPEFYPTGERNPDFREANTLTKGFLHDVFSVLDVDDYKGKGSRRNWYKLH